MSSPLAKTALALIVAVMVIAAILLFGVCIQHRTLSKDLADDVISRSQPHARPVHRLPALDAGTFEDCIGPLIDTARAELAQRDGGAIRSDNPANDSLTSVLDGTGELAKMDPAVVADLEAWQPNVRAQLDCTRAPAVGTAPGLGPFAEWDGPRQFGPQWGAVSKVTRFTLRRALAAHDPAQALRLCSDFLALSRDLAWDRGLIGAMLGAAQMRSSMPSCAEAIGAARREEVAAFLDELKLIRVGVPGFKWIMETERAQMQLIVFGAFMTEADRDRMPPGAQRLSRAQLAAGTFTDQLLNWADWSYFAGRADQLVLAADSPNRDLRFDVLAKPGLFERLAGTVPSSMAAFGRRYDVLQRGLDLLETAARVRVGEEPLPSVTVSDTVLSVPGVDGEILSIPR